MFGFLEKENFNEYREIKLNVWYLSKTVMKKMANYYIKVNKDNFIAFLTYIMI